VSKSERPQRLGGLTRALKRTYRIVVAWPTLALYAFLAPFGYVAFATMALVPTRDPVRRSHFLQGIMRRAFAAMHHWLRWLRILDYDPRKIEGVIPDQPCVVVSNHPALDDVTTVMSAIPRVCTAVNRRTFHYWWLRPLLEQAGQFSGGVATILGSATVLESAEMRLSQGFHVLVFPEGHRSPRGKLRPFARGAFEIACRVGVPIVPILIRAEPLWLARGDTVMVPTAELARKRVKILEPLDPEDFGRDSRAMRDHTEAMYCRILGTTVDRGTALPSGPTPNVPAINQETSAGDQQRA
jgi:1-acyl-sn-glycerol-3-phosphate acyltransferase